MVLSFNHVHIYCGDIEKQVAFFRELFGGKELSRERRPNSIMMIRMEIQGVPFAFMTLPVDKGQLEPGKGKRGLDHIGFTVKDLKTTLEEMKRKGVLITQDLTLMPNGAKIAFIEGPEGLRIELIQPAS